MKKKISRRKFIGLSAAFGSFTFLPGGLFRSAYARNSLPIAKIISVESSDYYKATVEAVKALGGISQFIAPKSKVGLLVNGNFTNEGTFTNPDISLAALKMCFDAGAKEVMLFRGGRKENWKKSAHYNSHINLLEKTTRSSGDKIFAIDRGIALKKARMIQEILDLDCLINIPIVKQHSAAFMSCSLKNLMGLNARTTNLLFHSPSEKGPTDKNHLAQCIADLNTLRKPDLTIVDATSFITTGGPVGPGEILQLNRVLAGTDPVALDAHCAGFFDYEPGIVLSTDYAAEHHIGIGDLGRIEITNITLD